VFPIEKIALRGCDEELRDNMGETGILAIFQAYLATI